MTYWLVVFLKVAAFANQAELVLGLLLWSRAGRSVHQRAGPCVGSGRTRRVSPTSSRSSHGPPWCLTRLQKFKLYKLIKEHWKSITSCGEMWNDRFKMFIRRFNYRSGCRHCHASWEESRYFVELRHELCKLKINKLLMRFYSINMEVVLNNVQMQKVVPFLCSP